jgi:hypothetical protein
MKKGHTMGTPEPLPFCFQLSNVEVLKAVEEYVNRTLFKVPLHLTDMTPAESDSGFDFTAAPIAKEPRTPKAKREPKPTKRGLAKPVLEQQAKPNGGAAGRKIADIPFAPEEPQEA